MTTFIGQQTTLLLHYPITKQLVDSSLALKSSRRHVYAAAHACVCCRFVRDEVDDATTPERCAYYCWLFSDVVWPGGVLDDTESPEISAEQRDVTRRQARQCLYDFFPGASRDGRHFVLC